MSEKNLEDLFFWMIFGVLIGGRFGYVLFYNLDYYLSNPLEIIWPFSSGEFVGISGMSFHGGLIACILLGIGYVKWKKLDLSKVSDLVISIAPLGYFVGRIGNFLNNELYGRETTSNVGMYFKDSPETLRHASQLYQGLLEGLLLFGVLSLLYKKDKFEGKLLGIGLVWFGVMRFVIEFFREPDSHIGLVEGLSRGQFLSFALIIIGGIFIYAKKGGNLNK
jgi:phosphatidylglycerol:prolipoprotein diacylglycerol transferase